MRIEGAAFTFRVHVKRSLPARIAVVVSKRVAKKAVARNRLKRRVTEWLRTKSTLAHQPIDIIVHTKPTALALTRLALYKELKSMVERARGHNRL